MSAISFSHFGNTSNKFIKNAFRTVHVQFIFFFSSIVTALNRRYHTKFIVLLECLLNGMCQICQTFPDICIFLSSYINHINSGDGIQGAQSINIISWCSISLCVNFFLLFSHFDMKSTSYVVYLVHIWLKYTQLRNIQRNWNMQFYFQGKFNLQCAHWAMCVNRKIYLPVIVCSLETLHLPIISISSWYADHQSIILVFISFFLLHWALCGCVFLAIYHLHLSELKVTILGAVY